MISALLLAAVLQASGLVDWSHVDININKLNPPLAPVTLPAVQMKEIRPLLVRSLGGAWPGCGSGTDTFSFFRTPLDPEVLNVEAGPGGCRGGQGSNGALWLIRRQGPRWQVLASQRTALVAGDLGFSRIAVMGSQTSLSAGIWVRTTSRLATSALMGTVITESPGWSSGPAAPKTRHFALKMAAQHATQARVTERHIASHGSGAVATPTKESAQP